MTLNVDKKKDRDFIEAMYQNDVIDYFESLMEDESKLHNWMAIMAIEKICGFLRMLGVNTIVVSQSAFHVRNIDWGLFCTEMEQQDMNVDFEDVVEG